MHVHTLVFLHLISQSSFAFPSQCAKKEKKENCQDRPDVSLDNSLANSVISLDSLRDTGLSPPSRHQNPKSIEMDSKERNASASDLNVSFSSEKMWSRV